MSLSLGSALKTFLLTSLLTSLKGKRANSTSQPQWGLIFQKELAIYPDVFFVVPAFKYFCKNTPYSKIVANKLFFCLHAN